MTMRVAVIGAGRIGAVHAAALAELPAVREVVVADLAAAAAQDLATRIGVAFAPTIEAAFDRVDAVVIAAATPAHAPLVRVAIARRLPIFCEKPLARDLAESIALAAEIEASGVPFQLGFQRRFDAGYRAARRLVETGDLGTLYLARLASHDPAPPPDAYIPVSGGLFRDLGIHDFDALRWLTGDEVVSVHAAGAVRAFPIFERHADVDTAVLLLRLAGGALATIDLARHDPLGYDVRAELFGSGDSIAVGLDGRTPLRSVEPGAAAAAGPAWTFFLDRFAGAYRAELAAFATVAAGGRPSPCTARDGVEALRIAEAAGRSLAEGRTVALAEIAGASVGPAAPESAAAIPAAR